MIRRVLSLIVVAFVGVILLYISRFWGFALWGSEGLFGIEALRPQGGQLRRWLAGTPLAPFELIIWSAGCFLVLTWLQRLFDRIGALNLNEK